MSRPIMQVLAPMRFPVVIGSLWLGTAGSAPLQVTECSCRHVEYPAADESTYASDTTQFLRMDSVHVAYMGVASPSPTLRLIANMRPAESQQVRTLRMRIDPTADAVFMSTYSVENLLARHYDKTDRAKARALRGFIARNWGSDRRQMALLCQHFPSNNSWSCADSTQVRKYPGERVTAMTIFGVVRVKGGSAPKAVRVKPGTDAVLNGREACKMLEDYYDASSDPRVHARGDSLRSMIAARKVKP